MRRIARVLRRDRVNARTEHRRALRRVGGVHHEVAEDVVRGLLQHGVYLGVGRNRTDETVCAEAGMIIRKRKGDAVKKGDLVMDVYGRDEASLSPALALLGEAVRYSPAKPGASPLILKEITAL